MIEVDHVDTFGFYDPLTEEQEDILGEIFSEFTLKNVTYHPEAHAETLAFEAELHFGGSLLARASNTGKGEETICHIMDPEGIHGELPARALAFLSKYKSGNFLPEHTAPVDLEECADLLISIHSFRNDLKRELNPKTHMTYIDWSPAEKTWSLFTIKLRNSMVPDAEFAAAWRETRTHCPEAKLVSYSTDAFLYSVGVLIRRLTNPMIWRIP